MGPGGTLHWCHKGTVADCRNTIIMMKTTMMMIVMRNVIFWSTKNDVLVMF